MKDSTSGIDIVPSSRVKIRSDYNYMRRTLREQYRQRRMSDGDELRRRILALADLFEYVHFAWVPRRKNQMAHALARQAVRHGAAGASEREPAEAPR
jgi:ribonuclease HI